MNTIMAWAASARRDFVDALGMFQSDEPIGIISHNDADGLASAAIITRSLEGIGRPSWVRVLVLQPVPLDCNEEKGCLLKL